MTLCRSAYRMCVAQVRRTGRQCCSRQLKFRHQRPTENLPAPWTSWGLRWLTVHRAARLSYASPRRTPLSACGCSVDAVQRAPRRHSRPRGPAPRCPSSAGLAPHPTAPNPSRFSARYPDADESSYRSGRWVTKREMGFDAMGRAGNAQRGHGRIKPRLGTRTPKKMYLELLMASLGRTRVLIHVDHLLGPSNPGVRSDALLHL
jgi:hypothetical protein